MKRVLIAVTNHPVRIWSSEQKMGWDDIIEIPFPHINAALSVEEVKSIVHAMYETILSYVKQQNGNSIYVYIAGEYTFSYLMLLKLKEYDEIHKEQVIKFVVPTSDRIIKKGGERVFQFIQWRQIF